jgi:hypothetical protein
MWPRIHLDVLADSRNLAARSPNRSQSWRSARVEPIPPAG